MREPYTNVNDISLPVVINKEIRDIQSTGAHFI